MSMAVLTMRTCLDCLATKPRTEFTSVKGTPWTHSRSDANDLPLEAAPVVSPLRPLLDKTAGSRWDGTATELLQRLNVGADEGTQRLRSWPKEARTLSNALRRLVAAQPAVGEPQHRR
jgi:hypothetical protein